MTSPPRTAGRVLIAPPALRDPHFVGSVVLVLSHDDEGAFGLVLNEPAEVVGGLDEVLGPWLGAAAHPQQLFVGGPVDPRSVLGLAELGDPLPEGCQRMHGALGLVDLRRDELAVALSPRLRLFAGYSGWGPGQLETELEAGAWLVADPAPDDVFSPRPDRLWSALLRRQGGDTAHLATWTGDAAWN